MNKAEEARMLASNFISQGVVLPPNMTIGARAATLGIMASIRECAGGGNFCTNISGLSFNIYMLNSASVDQIVDYFKLEGFRVLVSNTYTQAIKYGKPRCGRNDGSKSTYIFNTITLKNRKKRCVFAIHIDW